MNTQISLKLSEKMFNLAKKCAETNGFDTLQELIRELLRRQLYQESIGGMYTAIASEKSLGKLWLTKEENEAWAHLQKES